MRAPTVFRFRHELVIYLPVISLSFFLSLSNQHPPLLAGRHEHRQTERLTDVPPGKTEKDKKKRQEGKASK